VRVAAATVSAAVAAATVAEPRKKSKGHSSEVEREALSAA
jgi:hypothetical protein